MRSSRAAAGTDARTEREEERLPEIALEDPVAAVVLEPVSVGAVRDVAVGNINDGLVSQAAAMTPAPRMTVRRFCHDDLHRIQNLRGPDDYRAAAGTGPRVEREGTGYDCFTAQPDTLWQNGFAQGGQNETCATYNLLKLGSRGRGLIGGRSRSMRVTWRGRSLAIPRRSGSASTAPRSSRSTSRRALLGVHARDLEVGATRAP